MRGIRGSLPDYPNLVSVDEATSCPEMAQPDFQKKTCH
jgi:hypothetical protein